MRSTVILNLIRNKIIQNGWWLYLALFFNTAFPLLTLPYVSRILGASGYGVFATVLNIMTYCQTFIEYGFNLSATRKIALIKHNRRGLNSTFSVVICTKCILMLISIVCIFLYVSLFNISYEIIKCYIIMTIFLLGICLQQNWLFQGLEDVKYISLINIIIRLIFTACVFIFVKTHHDIYIYCFLYAIVSLINGILGTIIAMSKYKICVIRISINDIMNEIKNGFNIFTVQLSSKIFSSIGITFLIFFTSSKDVGIYSAIQKIPTFIILLWLPISQILYPISTQKMKDSFSHGILFIFKIQKILLSLFSCIIFVMIIFARDIVTVVLGQEFLHNYYWAIPLLLWCVVAINNNFLGIQILLASGHDKEYSHCFQISVFIMVILNLVLIYFWGGNGASVAPFISESILGVLLYYQIRRLRKKYKLIS